MILEIDHPLPGAKDFAYRILGLFNLGDYLRHSSVAAEKNHLLKI